MAVIREALEEPKEERKTDSFEEVEREKMKLFHTQKEAWQTYGIKRHLGKFLFILAGLALLGFLPLIGEVEDTQAVVVPASLIHVEALKYGQVSKVNVKEGDRVEAGSTLVLIENPGDLLEIGESQSDASAFESGLRLLDLKRIHAFERLRADQGLLKKRVISRDEFDASELSFKTLESERKALAARLHWLRDKLKFLLEEKERGVILAPLSGTVISDAESLEGSFVNKGEFLMTLASDEARIEFLMREEDYGRVEVGDQGQIHFYAFPGKRYEGEVIRVKHYAEPLDKHGFKTAGVKVLVKLKDVPQGVRNGMQARVRIRGKRISFFDSLRRRI